MKAGEVQGDIWWLMEKEGVSRVMPMNELCKTNETISSSLFYAFFSRLPAANFEMRTGGSWVLANVNVTGFYRVNYDLGNWERLLAQLQSEHQVHSRGVSTFDFLDFLRFSFLFQCLEYCIVNVCILNPVVQVIPVINRAQLVDDAFNLARFVFWVIRHLLHCLKNLSSWSNVHGANAFRDVSKCTLTSVLVDKKVPAPVVWFHWFVLCLLINHGRVLVHIIQQTKPLPFPLKTRCT